MAGTYLTTSFKDRADVKALGARWDAERRQWYVPDGRDLAPFATWLPAAMAPGFAPSSTAAVAVADPTLALPSRDVSLSQLMAGVADAVSQAYRTGVWVRVEVTNARINRGSIYLELSERGPDGAVIAQARGVIWADTANRIVPAFEKATGVVLGGGIKLLLRARPNVHASYGLSLVIDAIDPDYTLGDLEARKREIRARLQREGLFEANRSLEHPWDYRAVLVLAPPDAAGLGDFQVEAERLQRAGICRFTYVHSRFQGEDAPAEMRRALLEGLASWAEDAGAGPDAVVIIRGGGAVNDLAWLNHYELARCVCELEVPVLTGIGHERDSTVLDEVANIRFDTPSKVIAGIEGTIVARTREAKAAFQEVAAVAGRSVAQLGRSVDRLEATVRAQALRHIALAKSGADHAMRVTRQSSRITLTLARDGAEACFTAVRRSALAQVADARQRVPVLLSEVRSEARQALRSARLRIDGDVAQTMSLAAAASRRERARIDDALSDVAQEARRSVGDASTRAEALVREITGQGPEKTLRRGFAIVRDPAGQAVTSAERARFAPSIQIQFNDGAVGATVTSPQGETS